MVGGKVVCKGCGAPLRKDWEYCNSCGLRAAEGRAGVAGKRPGAPRILPSGEGGAPTGPVSSSAPALPPQERTPRADVKGEKGALPRRELLIALVAMLTMVPLSPWVTTFGGLIGCCALESSALSGRYIALLGIGGLAVLFSERLVPALAMRRAALLGVGAGAVGLTAMDIVDIIGYNADAFSSLEMAAPGLGMYIAIALGAGVIVAVLVPARHGSPSSRRAHAPVRRGSPGSALSARR